MRLSYGCDAFNTLKVPENAPEQALAGGADGVLCCPWQARCPGLPSLQTSWHLGKSSWQAQWLWISGWGLQRQHGHLLVPAGRRGHVERRSNADWPCRLALALQVMIGFSIYCRFGMHSKGVATPSTSQAACRVGRTGLSLCRQEPTYLQGVQRLQACAGRGLQLQRQQLWRHVCMAQMRSPLSLMR